MAALPQSGTPADTAALHNCGHCMSMAAHRHGPACAITAPRRRLRAQRARGSCARPRPGGSPQPRAGARPTDPARGLGPLRGGTKGRGVDVHFGGAEQCPHLWREGVTRDARLGTSSSPRCARSDTEVIPDTMGAGLLWPFPRHPSPAGAR